MRQAAKVDANQGEIVAALRSIGAAVQSLAAIGHGVPDLLIAWHGVLYLMEVKDGSKPPSKRRLTPDEQAWHDTFSSHTPIYVVETVDQALAAIGAI